MSGIRLKAGQAGMAVRCSYAMIWHRVYQVRYRLSLWTARHSTVAVSVVLLLLAGISGYLAPSLQDVLEPYFATNERLAGLQSLLLTLGGALIGAAAIAFALVMFAMQVNVVRMPHGLFRKLSSDWRLLGAFASTFLLAIAVATLSLIPSKSWLAVVVLGAGWGTVLVLANFYYAYRRALSLIDPSQQLALVVEDARREMQVWVRRARRAAPLLEQPGEPGIEQSSLPQSTHDLTRLAYFQHNPHWMIGARKAIMYAMSFTRRYAEQGDHEVSVTALSAVVGINAAYVEAKGKTFFTTHLMFDNPLTTDGFINDTLELVRQNARIAVSRGDEQQIEQTLNAMAALVLVYLDIDYSDEHASKTHAHLAAGYLSDAVQSVVPHDMADVLMEGARLMGQSAQHFLARAGPNDIVTLTEKIALVASAGIAKEKHRPVTLSGMEQLAILTFDLIVSKAPDIRFAAGGLKKNVALVSKLFLVVPDAPLSNVHSTYLGPYYSGTSSQALLARLSELTNALLEAKIDNRIASTIVRNFEQWADGLYRTEKELLLRAIEKKSHFTSDMIHWIAHVTKLLLAISNVSVCDDPTRNDLRKHALWLISTLSWVPDDKDSVVFVEIFQLTETLFDAAMDAHDRDCMDVSETIRDLLLSWAFKASRHETGWAILEKSVYGLAILVLMREDAEECSKLESAISERLAKEKAPSQETRDHAAREIRRRAATLYQEGHWSSSIENAMGHADHGKLRPLLENIAYLLSPGTANEPVDLKLF